MCPRSLCHSWGVSCSSPLPWNSAAPLSPALFRAFRALSRALLLLPAHSIVSEHLVNRQEFSQRAG